MTSQDQEDLSSALAPTAREIEEFANSAGWDQPTQVFALVSTTDLRQAQPQLADQLEQAGPLTPLAQEELPSDDLAEALAQIMWPDTVTGCAAVQEILVLPPESEHDLPDENTDPETARKMAAEHPERREARLVAAVLAGGARACVMRVRGTDGQHDEVVEDPELAPNLAQALLQTFES